MIRKNCYSFYIISLGPIWLYCYGRFHRSIWKRSYSHVSLNHSSPYHLSEDTYRTLWYLVIVAFKFIHTFTVTRNFWCTCLYFCLPFFEFSSNEFFEVLTLIFFGYESRSLIMDAASLHDRQNLEVKEEITLKGAGL